VLHRLERDAEALAAAQQAIRLDPSDEEGFSLLASIHLARRDWPAALTAAESGLTLNPEHVRSANLRAMALVRLGRKTEAMTTIDFALERAPENGFSHANQGWNCLHRNEPREAQKHFREALRLEPDMEYARHGMLEALRARNPIYRGMLAYFLWMGRQSSRLQWAFIIGTYIVMQFVVAMTDRWPLLWILVGLFYLFVYLSWTSVPMFNLMLRLHPFGRFVLSADERKASYWFGGFLFSAPGALAASFTLGSFFFIVFIVLLILSVCIAATFGRTGRNRLTLAGATALIGLIAAAGCIALFRGNEEFAIQALRLSSYGFLGFQILANTLGRR